MDECCSESTPNTNARLTDEQASALEEMFKVLANDTRLKLLSLLCANEELSVGELAIGTGMSFQAVSGHLQRLSLGGIIAARRHKNHIHYRLVDNCVRALLEKGLCLLEDSRQANGSKNEQLGR